VPHQLDYDHDYDNDNEKLDATAQMLEPQGSPTISSPWALGLGREDLVSDSYKAKKGF